MAKRIALFASGAGTLTKATYEAGIPIALMVTDRECPAIKIALDARVTVVCLPQKPGMYRDDAIRSKYTDEVMVVCKSFAIDLIAMMGYRTVLSPRFFLPENYGGKVLNSHPSLWGPDGGVFKGDHAVRDALFTGATETGSTIHWATEKVDEGPYIVTETEQVRSDDTVDTLHERIKVRERRMYATVLRDLLS